MKVSSARAAGLAAGLAGGWFGSAMAENVRTQRNRAGLIMLMPQIICENLVVESLTPAAPASSVIFRIALVALFFHLLF